MKTGWKTTEFWQTSIAQVLAFLTMIGVLTSTDSQTLADAITKGVLACFALVANGNIVVHYIKTRFVLKAQHQETTKGVQQIFDKTTVYAIIGALSLCFLGSPVQAQVMPWRAQIAQKLQQHDAQINNLKSTPAPSAPQAPQIIVVPAPQGNPPLQSFPIAGTPNQPFPIQGAPEQTFPIQGAPKQSFPIQGAPQQNLPIQGAPKQQFPIDGPAQPLPIAPPTQPPNQGAPAPTPSLPAPGSSSPQSYSRHYALFTTIP